MHIIIVGGGVAGLTCAHLLDRAGHTTVTLFEASDAVGGRVRSDTVDGYTLDRGFQVLFDAYPALQRQCDMQALQVRCFDPGAIICHYGRRALLTDPLRDHTPAGMVATASTPLLSPLDKLRMLHLAHHLLNQSINQLGAGTDMTTLDYLQQRGFSRRAIELFFRPFFGGTFLDRSLTTSARTFKFNFKMLCEGRACVPAGGMGTVSQQLATTLQQRGRIHLNARVVALLSEGEHVVGVRLEDGSEHHADAVVLATPAPEARRLSALDMPTSSLQTVTLYFRGHIPLYQDKKLVLNAMPDAFVNNAQMMSNIAPEYAPPARHLLSAMILGVPPLDDDELFARGLADIRLMFCGDKRAQLALETYRPLRLYRIPYAQFVQPPGIHTRLPANESSRPGLYFAAEFTEASSLNAAMVSGEKCAEVLLRKH